MRKKILILVLTIVSIFTYSQTAREWLNKANVHISKNENKKAEQCLLKAISLTDPAEIDLYKTYANLGTVQRRIDKKKEALDSYNKALRIMPTSVFVLNNRASLKLDLKDFKGALEDYNIALHLDSLNEEIYINRAYLYKKMRDTSACVLDLKKALKIKPYSLPARNNYADVLMNQGKLTEALKIFTDLSNEYPNEPILLNNLAEVNLKMKNLDVALKYVNKAIAIKPAYDVAYVTRAEVAIANGDLKSAKKDLQKAVKLGNDDSKTLSLLSKCN